MQAPDKIDELITTAIAREGGYVNHPADKGGETCWGITVKVARAFGYQGDMRSFPQETAALIYRDLYWNDSGFYRLNDISPMVAEKLFDIGINCGIDFAAKTLQRCLNVLNNLGKDFDDLVLDGRVGSLTVKALAAFVKKRGGQGLLVLRFMLAAQQSNLYLTMAERDRTQEVFEYGWQSQRALLNVVANA